MGKKKNFNCNYNPLRQWESAWKNNIAYMHYYQYFKNIAINMYKWENLPGSIDQRFLELMLFERGMVVFFYDEIMEKYLCLNTTIGGLLNVYNIPTRRTAYASNGYNRNLNVTDSVIIFDNYLHTTKHLDVDFFAQKLYNIDRTIDVNLNVQKTPYFITCPEDKKLTLKNIFMKIDGNEPVIYGYKDILEESEIGVLKTDAPYLVDKLLADKSKIWNEAMTFLGVNNANTEKRERMVSAEVEANDSQIIMSRQVGLNARRQACDKINTMFGLNIKVGYNDIDFSLNTEPQMIEEEDEPIE